MKVSLRLLWGLFEFRLSDESDSAEENERQPAVAGFALDAPAEVEEEDGADETT